MALADVFININVPSEIRGEALALPISIAGRLRSGRTTNFPGRLRQRPLSPAPRLRLF